MGHVLWITATALVYKSRTRLDKAKLSMMAFLLMAKHREQAVTNKVKAKVKAKVKVTIK